MTPSVPRTSSPSSLPSRPEAHRGRTEAAMRAAGCRWARLEMFPGDRLSDDPAEIAAHKARHYGDSGCGFF